MKGLSDFFQQHLFDHKTVDFYKFASALFNLFRECRECREYPSLIYKQVQKQRDPKLNMMFWANLYAFILSQQNFSPPLSYEMFDERNILNIIKTDHVSLVLISPIHDIYFLSRMLKKPTNGISPSLVFGYFGASHCKSITSVLKLFLGYLIEYNYDDDNEDRCIFFDKQIDLTNEVHLHNK